MSLFKILMSFMFEMPKHSDILSRVQTAFCMCQKFVEKLIQGTNEGKDF